MAERLSRVLSVGTPVRTQAGWIEGFLAGGGLVVAHDATLLGVLDDWLATVPGDALTDVLPVLRRTFGAMPAAERRAIGGAAARRAARRGWGGPPALTGDDGGLMIDDPRIAGPLATALLLLGGGR